MDLKQFANKWLGKRTDYDKVYRYQCVDLILQYLADSYGVTSGVWGNAIDYWTKPTPALLRHFGKAPDKNPCARDIIILSPTRTNSFGHIGIVMDSSTMLEQNGATGDGDGVGGDEVRYRTIPKDRIAGLLRPKGTDMYEGKTAEQHAIAGNYWHQVAEDRQDVIERLENEVQHLKAVTGDTEANVIGKALLELLKRFGYRKG